MSSRLIKNGMGLVQPVEDEVYVELVIARSGVKLKSSLPPAEVYKLLNNLSTDIMFNSFQPVEVPKIQPA